MIGGHGNFGVVEIEVVGEVVLSTHGLGDVVGDIDGRAGGRHGDGVVGRLTVEELNGVFVGLELEVDVWM